MRTLHIICGLPAVGKTTYAKALACDINAAFFDSDTATDLMIKAAHSAADLDPNDRDSPLYKQTYREPVYETLFALAIDNLTHTDVIIAGPFTSELTNKAQWLQNLERRFPNNQIKLHHLELSEEERITRMQQRGAARDKNKLES